MITLNISAYSLTEICTKQRAAYNSGQGKEAGSWGSQLWINVKN